MSVGSSPLEAVAQARVRRARKMHPGCGGYCKPIQPGELYIEHTEFPGGDSGYADSAGHPVRGAECRACAERYGRGHLFTAYLAVREPVWTSGSEQ